jgi:hypothetical protein
MMNPFREWNRFWFGPISARPLGAFRVVFGVLVLANLALLTADLDYWFSNTGFLQGAEAREVAGPWRPSPLLWADDPLTIRLFFGATAIVATLFTLGWHTRIMGGLLYLMMLSIHHRNVLTNSGPDTLLLVMLFYAMLSPCGAAFSLDSRRRSRQRGTIAEPLILPWAQRLIQLQLTLVYLNTAVLKCNGSTWLTGTALHYIVNNSEVGRTQLNGLVNYPVLINILTFVALFAEFAIPFLLWFRPTRAWAALVGLGLHVGVHFTVNVPIFGEVMTASYLVFLAPDELDALLRFVNPLTWLRRTSQAGEPKARIVGRVDPSTQLAGPHRPQGVSEPVAVTFGTNENPLGNED